MILNFKDEIENYINNVEKEEYCKLSDKEIEEIANATWEEVAYDNQLMQELNSTIEYYVGKYLANKEMESEDNGNN